MWPTQGLKASTATSIAHRIQQVQVFETGVLAPPFPALSLVLAGDVWPTQGLKASTAISIAHRIQQVQVFETGVHAPPSPAL